MSVLGRHGGGALPEGLYAYTGNPAAHELFEYLVTKLPEQGRINRVGAWFVLHEVIEACAVMDKPYEPERCYGIALQLQQQGVVMTWSLGLLERFLGIAAMSAGNFDVAEQHFRTGLHQAESIPVVPEQGEMRRWWAIMLQRRDADGDREFARELLADARGGLSQMRYAEARWIGWRIVGCVGSRAVMRI